MNRIFGWLFQRDRLLPLAAGLCDGILTALTLAAGRMLDADRPMTMSVALRVSTGALASSAFIFFVGYYASLRGELIHAERELSLLTRGHFAETKLGAAILREALTATLVASVCSFLGALAPLIISALWPRRAWLGIVAAIGILGLLGLSLAKTLYGNSARWALALILSGLALAYLGFHLRIA